MQRYASLDQCMELWQSDHCGSCGYKWYQCVCMEADGEDIETHADIQLSIDRLEELYPEEWDTEEDPQELPDIESRLRYNVHSLFCIRVQCRECGDLEEYKVDLESATLGKAQERARNKFWKQGWRRATDAATDEVFDMCPDCVPLNEIVYSINRG